MCATNPITRGWIGRTAYELRHRTGFNASECNRGVHGGPHTEVFNTGFHNRCGDWIVYFNDAVVRTTVGWTVNWVGDIGVTACDDASSFHFDGRAFDLSAIRFTNGNRIDMNRDWRRVPGNDCYSAGPETAVHRGRRLAPPVLPDRPHRLVQRRPRQPHPLRQRRRDRPAARHRGDRYQAGPGHVQLPQRREPGDRRRLGAGDRSRVRPAAHATSTWAARTSAAA